MKLFGNKVKDGDEEKPIVFYFAKQIGVLETNISSPKEEDAYVYLYEDRIDVKLLKRESRTVIPYKNMTDLQNMDAGNKVDIERVVGLGVIPGPLWKKRHIVTVIKYTDDASVPQIMALDFRDDTKYAQPLIDKKFREVHPKLPPKVSEQRPSQKVEQIDPEIMSLLLEKEQIVASASQKRLVPGGSMHTPNAIYVTNIRVLFKDPKWLGMKANIVDIHYKDISNTRLKRGIFSTEIYLEARHHSDEVRLPAVDRDIASEIHLMIQKGIRGELLGQSDTFDIPRDTSSINEDLSRADNNTTQPLNQEGAQNIDDPLHILKIRFAKGEITKEQYEEMRKMLES